MSENLLDRYPHAMTIDPETGKPMPKVAVSDNTGGGASGIVDTNLKSSEIALPVDVQARYARTIQTHSQVAVASAAWSEGMWIDADGYDRVALTMTNSGFTTAQANIQWSHDGVNVQGMDYAVCPSDANNHKAGETGVKARYLRVQLYNAHSASATLNCWARLKV